jgi:putative FmdB family regulatory protein
MPAYRHTCRACEIDWDEIYSIHDEPPTECPECGSDDVYRNVTTSGAVHFKGSGWSPDGYYNYNAYDKHKAEGKSVKLYDRKEDLDRDMRGEAEHHEKQRLLKVDRAARRHMSPDAGLTQAEADKKIKAAGDKAVSK